MVVAPRLSGLTRRHDLVIGTREVLNMRSLERAADVKEEVSPVENLHRFVNETPSAARRSNRCQLQRFLGAICILAVFIANK